MKSDYEDLGISPSDDRIKEIISGALRGRDDDFSNLGLNGVIDDLDYNSPDVKVRARELVKKTYEVTGVTLNPNVLIDFFYLAFLSKPKLKPRESLDRNQVLHHDIMSSFTCSSSIIDAIRYSALSPAVSFGTAITFAASLLEALEKIRENGSKEDSDAAKRVIQYLTQQPQNMDENERAGNQETEEDSSVIPVILSATSKAGEKALEKAENIDTMEKIAGKSSAADSKTDPNEAFELSKNLNVSNVLQIVMNMATEEAKFKTKKYIPGTPGQPIDLKYGRDIRRIHPNDAALPEDEFWLRFAEGKLRNIEEGNPQAAGPIYLLVDRSGSMSTGSRSSWSKAVALKLFQETMATGAGFYMRYFDAMPHDLMRYNKSTPRRSRLDAIRKICEMAPDGGTDIRLVLRTAMDDIESSVAARRKEEMRPTLILITDGEDNIMDLDLLRSRINSLGIPLVSVMISGTNKGLEAISTKYLEVRRTDAKSGLQIVDAGIRTRSKVRQ